MSERYAYAQQQYQAIGVDTEQAIEKLSRLPVSIHCWQGDDLTGFENRGGTSGGILATGNFPGRATTPEQLMQDLDTAFSLIPGKKRLNLHAVYAVTGGKKVDRDQLLPEHFEAWVEYAKARGLGLDMNPTYFSHEKVKDGLTLSSPDPEVRRFWIDHTKACRKIAEYFGKELGTPSLVDVWIPDGLKDVPADRMGPRKRLKESLDEIYAQKVDPHCVIDCMEAKLFGIGVESYTVGSHEFYMNYAAKNDLVYLIDNGHFHPTESCADKLSSLLLFSDKVALHLTRGVRWDSDHVIALDDSLKEMCREIVACDALDRVIIGSDYFDASINRVAAWVIGARNIQKALLYALLIPNASLAALQDEGRFTELLAMQEEIKTFPFTDVWAEYCRRMKVPAGPDWMKTIHAYTEEVLSKR